MEIQELARAIGLDGETAAHVARHQQAASQRPINTNGLSPISASDLRLTTRPTRHISNSLLTPSPQAPAPDSCQACGGIGWYKEAVPVSHPHFGKLFPCRCTQAVQAKRAQQERSAVLDRLASELGTLARCTLTNYDVQLPKAKAHQRCLEQARKAVAAYAENPGDRWLYLHGPVGTGKSHLAAAAAHVLAEVYDQDAYYRSVPDMIDAIRSGYREGDYDARLEAVKSVPILVLDDLGTEDPTPKALALLFQIVQYRAIRDSITLITSNLSLDQYAGIDDRIASRIRGRSLIIPVISEDARALLASTRRSPQ